MLQLKLQSLLKTLQAQQGDGGDSAQRELPMSKVSGCTSFIAYFRGLEAAMGGVLVHPGVADLHWPCLGLA
jgi:hypothetical protein